MKRSITIIGLLLIILLIGNGCHKRYDRHNLKDNERMIGSRMEQNFRHNRTMQGPNGRMFHGMRPGMRGGMGPGMNMGMMIGMRPGMGPGMGMRGNMGSMPGDSTVWMPMGPGRRMMESIPNVTENQKKQLMDLMTKQREEMQKIRDEMSSKMQNLMESHQKDMMKILTDDQKKFVEASKFPSGVPQK